MVGLFFGTGSGTVVIQKNIKQGHVIVEGVIGLRKACQKYDESNEIFMVLRNGKHSVKADLLDAPLGESGNVTLQDLIEDTRPMLDETYVDFMDFFGKLSDPQKQVIGLREQGASQTDIATAIGVLRAEVGRKLRSMHRAYRA